MEFCASRSGRRLACVLLAAGESRRLGFPKQLLRRRLRPLLLCALDVTEALEVERPVTVVLGAHAIRLRAALRRHGAHVRIVQNANWRGGLASSLQAGLAALPSDAAAALVLLTDQPNVDAEALKRLIAAWRRRPRRPAAAFYAGRAGVPAILPRASWAAARRLEGDVGARALLRDASAVTLVDFPEAALDIDTPADLRAWREGS